MKKQKGFTIVELMTLLGFLGVALAICGTIAAKYYSYIFAKTVEGKVTSIQSIQPNALVTSRSNAAAMFSSALMIQTQAGEVFTASTEDRQWFVVKEGMCVKAKLFPYAPWHLDKAGTYGNARLVGVSAKCW